MFSALPRLLPILWLMVQGSCGPPKRGPGVALRLAGLPTATGCLLPDGQPVSSAALIGQSGTLRLSVVSRGADRSARFVCDASARVPEESPDLVLGAIGERFDLHAELFDAAGARIAAGALPDFSNDEEGTPQLHLFRVSTWSCPKGALKVGRAFHTATPLASGQVLLVGGVAPLPERGPAAFQLLSSVEVYEPKRGEILPVSEARGVVPRPRAFHHAVVLEEGPEMVRLLVHGGVTAAPGQHALTGAPDALSLYRLAPLPMAQAAGAEILSYDVKSRALTRRSVPEGEVHKVAFQGGLPLLAGGLLAVGGTTLRPGLEDERSVVLLRPGRAEGSLLPRRTSVPEWLLAPSISPLGRSGALVIGAARSGPGAITPDVRLVGMVIGGLPDEARAQPAQAIEGPATIQQAAVALAPDADGKPRILVSGGFLMEERMPITARQPPPPEEAVRLYRVPEQGAPSLIRVAPWGPRVECGSPTPHYRAAGFEAASATGSGRRVIISGGTPIYTPGRCEECEPGDTGAIKLLCVLSQVSIYDADRGVLVEGPRLPLGRMGHSQTLLPDGSVLLAGGLTRPGGDTTVATQEVTVWSPRAPADEGDLDDPVAHLIAREGLRRAGHGLARPCERLR